VADVNEGLTRRRVLLALGIAGGASVVGRAAVAGAAPSPVAATAGFPPPPPGVSPGASAQRVSADALTAGLTYRLMDMTTWNTTDAGQFRTIRETGVSVAPVGGAPLVTAVDPPIGSVLKEVSVWYLSPIDGPSLLLVKKPLDGPVAVDDTGFPSAVAVISPLPSGAGTLHATLALNETIDGTATYPLIFFPTNDTQQVAAVRYGYVAVAQAVIAPPPAFIASTPTVRLLDTRLQGGKLKANEERVVALGVPPTAHAAVINLTITGTENSGFVAVFPADSAWPGNSSINWSASNENVANLVITATDTKGAIRLRGGVNPTHVVIDVQGYLL
jgi:hypothetical protein